MGGVTDPASRLAIDPGAPSRRVFIGRSLAAGAALAPRGRLASAVAAAGTTLVARPAAADTALDIQMLQTASAVETSAVSMYQAVLELGAIQRAAPDLRLLLETTSNQHAEHGTAVRAQTVALGGADQSAPHPTVQAVVDEALAELNDALGAVGLVERVETIATHTYLDFMTRADEAVTRQLLATIMGVDSQHAAVWRSVAALLAAGLPELVALPVDPAALPAALGGAATPEAIESAAEGLDPQSGGVPAETDPGEDGGDS